MAEDSKRERLQKIHQALLNERSSWDSHWREIERYVLPRRGRFLDNDKRNNGKKRHNNIVESSATTASRTLGAGMNAGVTNAARPWLDMTHQDPERLKRRENRIWVEEVRRRILRYFQRTNVYRVLPTIYQDCGTFGTAGISTMRHPERGLSFSHLPIGQYAMSADQYGRVNVVFRTFGMTTRQMIEQFGDACSKTVQDNWRNGLTEVWHDVVHATLPNADFDPGALEAKFKRFSSIYYEEKQEDKGRVLKESGFDRFPFLCPRWMVSGEDIYGTECPGMEALGTIKELQHQRKQLSEAVEKMNKPPMVGHPSLRGRPAALIPGQITFVEPFRDGRPGFSPAYQVNFDTANVREDIIGLRQEINHIFFKDMFLLLAASQDRGDKTATEIAELHEEKMTMLGPVLHQLDDDLLEPMVDLVFTELARKDELPPPPPDLQGEQLGLEFISILHQAQKLVGVAGMDRSTSNVLNVAQVWPEAVDAVDWDRQIDTYHDMLGNSPVVLRSQEDRQRVRQARAQAAEQARQAELLAVGASAAKDLGTADAGGGQSALARLVNQGAVR